MLHAMTNFILTTVLPIAAPILATAIAWLAVKVLVNLSKKIGLDIDSARESQMFETIRRLVLSVEEMAMREKKVNGITLSGSTKLASVVNAVTDRFPVSKVDAEQMVHSVIAAIPGVGATGNNTGGQ